MLFHRYLSIWILLMNICKLTKKTGKFVKSHIIPKALTKPEISGAPFVEFGMNYKQSKRCYSSWYDNNLVTREGENILSDYDDWAIRELRKNKLIWSSWESNKRLNEADCIFIADQYGFRNIYIKNYKKCDCLY